MPPTIVVCVLLVILYAIRGVFKRVFSVLDNIPGPPRKSLFTGNLTQFHDPDGELQTDLAQNYGQVVKIHGLFGERQLFVFDPVALHTVLVKDQDLYEEEEMFMCLSSVLFGRGVFSTIRDDHRKYRKIMMPAFSATNLREIIPLFYEVAERTRDGLIAPNIIDGPHTLEFNSIISRTSLELIGRAGIGYSFDPMIPGQEQTDRYAEAFRALLPAAFKLGLLLPLLPLVLKIPFPSFHRFMINLIPSSTLHRARDVVDFTNATAAQLVSERKAAILNGELDAKHDARDLMSVLMKGNMSSGGTHLTDNEMVAAISMILFAGTDTTSSAMNRILHLLALYPDVQEKLRAEILAAPEHMNHDLLTSLPYLDAVVREVLRLYPPPGPMSRIAWENTVLPVSTPIIGVDGTAMTTIAVPKGTPIHIAISAANHNKHIWGEDALEFRPDRWTNGRVDSVTTKLCGVDGSTMTFLGGGRSCIGFKFAHLEMKVVVCVLLRAFKFSKPDPRIKWRMNGLVAAPNIDNQPGLPILVEHLKT
ncbi:cytochrome P450 [Mycena vulgaris]|nr:cytochrome P450 [Mycena vulgaris]